MKKTKIVKQFINGELILMEKSRNGKSLLIYDVMTNKARSYKYRKDSLLKLLIDFEYNNEEQITHYESYTYNDDRTIKSVLEESRNDFGKTIGHRTFEYDENGRCILEHATSNGYDDKLNTELDFKYIYDDEGRLIRKELKDDNETIVLWYEYDDKGNVIKEGDLEESYSCYTYDDKGNRTHIENRSESNVIHCVDNVFNKHGQPIYAITYTKYDDDTYSADMEFKYYYDKHHRLSKVITLVHGKRYVRKYKYGK